MVQVIWVDDKAENKKWDEHSIYLWSWNGPKNLTSKKYDYDNDDEKFGV